MAAPWELYQQQNATEGKPWEAYQSAPEFPQQEITPPPIQPQPYGGRFVPPGLDPEEEILKEAQFAESHPYLYGGLKALTHVLPESWDEVEQMLTLPRQSNPEEQIQAGEEWGRRIRGEEGPIAQAETLTATGLSALPLALTPFMERPFGPVVPPPVPIQYRVGPLATVPDPWAPATAPPNLADAIRQAQQTRMDQALAVQAGRQAQPPLLTEQFAQPPQEVVGPAPEYDPMAAMRYQQQAMAEMQPLIAQEYLLKKMGQPIPKPLADAIKAGNEKLQKGYQPPPETRFVIPAAGEQPGAQYASPIAATSQVPQLAVRSPMAQGAPLRPAVAQPPQVQGPAGIGAGAQPRAPAPPAAGQPPFTGAHHEALVSEYGPQAIQRGTVKAPAEYIADARARAGRVDPYQAASKVRSGQAITPEELADLVVEHDRLRQAATDAEKTLQHNTNPQTLADWNEAMQAKQDFAQNVLKPAATRGFGEFGRVLQEVEPADPATMTGATEIAQQRLNRELKPSEKKNLAKNVEKTQKAVAKQDARAREAEKAVPAGKAATREQMANHMAKIVKDLTPCD